MINNSSKGNGSRRIFITAIFLVIAVKLSRCSLKHRPQMFQIKAGNVADIYRNSFNMARNSRVSR